MTPTDRMAAGVVLERRRIDNPWQDYAWRAVAVIPGAPPVDEWRLLRDEGERSYFHAATLDLELYARETDGYRVNLGQPAPQVFVVLRPGEDDDANEVEPFLVTACPYEGQDYEDSGEEIVDGVPMPDDMAAWVRAFIAKHHVEVPFRKRKRKPYDPRKGGFAGGAADG